MENISLFVLYRARIKAGAIVFKVFKGDYPAEVAILEDVQFSYIDGIRGKLYVVNKREVKRFKEMNKGVDLIEYDQIVKADYKYLQEMRNQRSYMPAPPIHPPRATTAVMPPPGPPPKNIKSAG